MTSIEKRLNDVEKSVKMIAEYVRQHTDKIESQLDDDEPLYSKTLKEEVEELKKRFDGVSAENHISPIKLKGIDHFEERIEGRLDKLEERLANVHEIKPDMKSAGAVSALRKDLEDFRHEVNPKIHFFEGKLNKLKEEVDDVSGSVNVDELHEKVGHIDEKLSHALSMKNRMDELEKIVKDMKELEKKLKTGEHATFEKFHTDLTGALKQMEGKIKALEETTVKRDAQEFKKMYSEIDTDFKKETDLLKGEVQEVKNIKTTMETRMKGFETKLTEREAGDFKKLYGDMEERVKYLTREVEKFEKLHAEGAKRTREEMEKQMQELDSNDREGFKRLTESLERRVKQMEESNASAHKFADEMGKRVQKEVQEQIKSLRERKSGFDSEGLRKLEEGLMQARAAIDNETANRMSAEKRLNELEGTLNIAGGGNNMKLAEQVNHRLNQMDEQISRIVIRDDKKIDEYIKNRIRPPQMDTELTELKKYLESETAKRLSLEKHLHETSVALKDAKEKLDGISNISELSKLGDRIHDIEKNMKLASVRLLTQQLNEFAKSMDKRIPNIVAKEEYMREVADIHRRLKTIESPDLAPLGSRVERLERKIDDISHLIRGLHNRVPVVVE